MLKTLFAILHAILLAGTFSYAAALYHPELLQGQEIPRLLVAFLFIGVIGVSFWWLLIHMFGGGLMGLFQGGVSEGVRMGLWLGFLFGLGRLWPYVLAWGLAAFVFAHNPWFNAILFGVLTIACFGLNRVMKYIWNKVEHG